MSVAWLPCHATLPAEPPSVGTELSDAQRRLLDDAERQMNEGLRLFAEGRPSDAIPLVAKAIEIRKTVLGEDYAGRVVDLNNLAELYQAAGDYARAMPLLERAVELAERTLGRRHPDYIVQVNNLAGLYQSMGDNVRAEPLLRQALAARKELLGEQHPDYAVSLNNLAGVYYAMGRYDRAEPLFRQALEIRKRALGENHPDCADSLDNLAAVSEARGDLDQAESLYRKAFEIRRAAFPPTHPKRADSLNNLAALANSRGRYEQAESLYREALEMRRQVFGPQHPLCAASLNNLAAVYRSTGDFDRARPLYREALQIIHRFLDETLDVLSEQQQLAAATSMRHTLDGYLSVTFSERSQEEVYPFVLGWKGLVFVKQRNSRLAADRPELAPVLAEMQTAASRLARLAFDAGAAGQEAGRKEFAEASERKAKLEAELMRRSREYRASRDAATPEGLEAVIPEDVAMVDFLQYRRSFARSEADAAPPPAEQHLVAFVVRRGRPLARVELGPVEPLGNAIEAWRRTCGREGVGADAGRQLRRLLWAPLEKHVEGAPTLLISPDGDLTRFPPGALPGSEAGTYLIEERALAVIPVPQALPGLLASRERRPASGGDVSPASLLVLGDIDYDALPQESKESLAAGAPAAGKGSMRFAPLRNSRGEMLAVRDSFEAAHPRGSVRLLRQDQATEAAFRREAAAHRFLHLTTHGFSAPTQLRSTLAPQENVGDARSGGEAGESGGLAVLHPGLLSGLALAGANAPVDPRCDDGILTAEEVASLPLGGVDLAVLSACETGLGQVARGEGVLGLQRAFQVAGARTVVASLWQVPDEATRTLMERFYENLWARKMPKLAALRDAQLSILNEQPRRGVVIEPDNPAAGKPRRPPYYWAAFVLSGDWQ